VAASHRRTPLDLTFLDTQDGVPTPGSDGPSARASSPALRHPPRRGRRLIGSLDIREAGRLCRRRLRHGYHVAELSRKLGRTGIIIVLRADATLLRAVLDQVDCSEWSARQRLHPHLSGRRAAMGEACAAWKASSALASPLCAPTQHRAHSAPVARFHERLTGIVNP